MYDSLRTKVLVLNQRLWEDRAKWPQVEAWLDNFKGQVVAVETERLHALYLLTHFLYFGGRQIRELLRALHRDFVLYPILVALRSSLGNTRDIATLKSGVDEELKATRFFGVGNPAESGTHLLYFFRQENGLPKDIFWETHKIFARDPHSPGARRDALRTPSVKRYIFLDDLCGSGNQASEYSIDLVEDIRRLNPHAEVAYYSLFATTEGMEHVRASTQFTRVESLYELDNSYRVFSTESRIVADMPEPLSRDTLRNMAEHYGRLLWPAHCLGYKDGQLLLGFNHNTPDNTLPIIWFDEVGATSWTPIFRRYPKVYNFPSAT